MLKNFKKKNNNKGFTLVELLVVIAIIGILAVVAVPSLFKQVDKSKVADIKATVGTIRTAVMANYSDTGVKPADIDALVTAGDLESDPSKTGKVTYALDANGVLTITVTEAYLSGTLLSTLSTDLNDTDTNETDNIIKVSVIK